MSKLEILNNVDHKDLRVIQGKPSSFGDAIHSCPCYSFEFRNLQHRFPILLQEVDQNKFLPVVLMGFEKGENLFVENDAWLTSYIPAYLKRGPFAIGVKKEDDGSESRLLSIDIEHPRVSSDEGLDIFQPLGGRTDYLESVADLMETIFINAEVTQQFTDTLNSHGLIESVTFDIKLSDGSQNQLLGFYTIDEERLKDLDSETLGSLSKKGFLMPIFMMLASLSNITDMVDAKQKRVSLA